MKALIAAVILSLAIAPAALAKAEKKEAAPVTAPYVSVDPVALPVVSAGHVVNYVFVTMRVDLAANANPDAMRAKEPFFRDALVRLGHRGTFNPPNDVTSLDEAKLCAAFLNEARAIAGPGAVTGVRIMMQTPKSTHVAVGG